MKLIQSEFSDRVYSEPQPGTGASLPMRTYRDLARDVFAMHLIYAKNKKKSFALYCNNSYIFTIHFLALILSKKKVILLPDNLPGTLKQFADSSRVDSVINPELKSDSNYEVPVDLFDHFDVVESQTEIVISTSGSSGTPKLISKTLKNLLTEVSVLQTLWGSQTKETLLISSVSHQHIYGLLFKILWPLSIGQTVLRELVVYPEMIKPLLERNRKICLISSPAHLSRFPKVIEISSWKNSVTTIFSSSADLPLETSEKYYRFLNKAPIEILGSTETGGIGYFQYSGLSTAVKKWKLLPHVFLKQQNQKIWISSPFINLKKGLWMEIEDNIALQRDSTFIHEGRKDDIVKIEGKRLSLAGMEKHILESSFVSDVRVFVQKIDLSDERNRIVVLSVLCLNKLGESYFIEKGKKALLDHIKLGLLRHHEPLTLPKKWRICDTLPRNIQGKPTYQMLTSLFVKQSAGSRQDFNIIQKNISKNYLELQIKIPEDLVFFKGHFEKMPVLPGVVQLNWAIRSAQENFSLKGKLTSVKSLKFQNIISPSKSIILSIHFDSKKNIVNFKYRSNLKIFSSGSIMFAA